MRSHLRLFALACVWMAAAAHRHTVLAASVMTPQLQPRPATPLSSHYALRRGHPPGPPPAAAQLERAVAAPPRRLLPPPPSPEALLRSPPLPPFTVVNGVNVYKNSSIQRGKDGSTIAGDDGALRGQNSIFSDVYTDAVTEAEGDSDEGARAALLRLSLRG